MPTNCKECGGDGVIERDGKLYSCECFTVRRAASAMPLHIRKASVLPKHLELLVLQVINNVPSWNRSIFMRGSYDDLKSVVKALMLKYPTKWIKLTSDAEIRNVYVGSMSKSSRSEDYSGDIYNTIQDLMEPPDLMMIHLNVISNKNKAAPGALEEAMLCRLNKAKPVWAFSDNANAFGVGSFAYSPRVYEILTKYMDVVDIPLICPIEQQEIQKSVFSPEMVSSKPASAHVPSKPASAHVLPDRPVQREEKVIIDRSDPLSGYGTGVKKKKNHFGRD